MQTLEDMTSVEEVDRFIDNFIDDDGLNLRKRAEAGCTPEERAKDPKLDALCKALERRAKLALA